jgi:FixJ family two-component response regulator
MPAAARRAKRVDLVVTDYDLPAGFAGRSDGNGLQQEFRCTIPLAVLQGDISGDALRECACVCRPWANDPLNADDFLRLIERLSEFLKAPAETEPVPERRQADPDDEMRIARLTPRELQVLDHVVSGSPNKITAAALNISRRTVEHHRAVIMHKTRTKSVPELVRLTLRTGLFAERCANGD